MSLIDVLTLLIVIIVGGTFIMKLTDTVLQQGGVFDAEIWGNRLKIESREGQPPAQPPALKQSAEPNPEKEVTTAQ